MNFHLDIHYGIQLQFKNQLQKIVADMFEA
jgi:hypothetical protein